MNSLRYWLLLILPVFSLVAVAQTHRLKFQHLTTEEGLSQSTVDCILQDSRGFMWFGTRDGLNKYDGYRFTVYKNDPNNPHSLSNNYIKDIIEDQDGNIWVATWGGGLDRLNRHDERFVHFRHSLADANTPSSNLINSLLLDHQGYLWIGTQDEGLDQFDIRTGRFVHYAHQPDDSNSLSNNFVRDIIEDSQQRIWVGTSQGGLNRFNPRNKNFTRIEQHEPAIQSLTDNNIWVLFEDSRHQLWVGTHGNGLYLWEEATGKFRHFKSNPRHKNGLVHDVIMSIGEDREGRVWVGTENGGISVYDYPTQRFYTYRHDDIDHTSLNNNSIYSIYQDSKGNMWVGTYSGGINFLNRDANQFTHYQHALEGNSLSHNHVTTFFEDSRGYIWIGSDGGGVNRFDPRTGIFKHYQHEEGNSNSICGNYILRVYEDSEHNIWVGTWGNGITVINPDKNTFRHLRNNPSDPGSLSGNNAWAIFEDRHKNVWVGPYFGTGLDLYDRRTGTFKHYVHSPTNPHSVSSQMIYTIFEDSHGYLWIGTDGGGVDRFDHKTQTFTRHQHQPDKNSLSNNSVYSIHEDRQGNFWFGTNVGLNHLDTKTHRFTTYTTKDGLPNDVVMGILEDEEGNLWLSTNNGLSRFDPHRKTFRNFTMADGLQAKEFKSNAFLKTRAGVMYFGGINGFNEFHPRQIKPQRFEPPLVLTNFQILNKQVPIGKGMPGDSPLQNHITETSEILLSYRHSVFSLEYASLNYTSADKKQYAYQLEGFDKIWNTVGPQRTATYTNLDPGAYVFRVKGLDSEGNWSSKMASLNIIITPPFWQTWWFKTAGVALLLGSVFSFYQIRTSSLQAQKLQLEKQVSERTRDLSQANQKLTETREEIQTQRDHLQQVNEQVMSSIRYANTIQKAFLPSKRKLKEVFDDCFVIYRPKDVVSGDFYWVTHFVAPPTGAGAPTLNDAETRIRFLAVVDCTGHGVPGAFMSIIGSTLLNEIVNQKQILDPARILEELHLGMLQTMEKSEEVKTAGMDVCLCRIESATDGSIRVWYAGAKRNLYLVRKQKGKPEILEATRRSIGSDSKIPFTAQQILLTTGDMLYLTTDGYADQNNPFREKMGSIRMRQLMLEAAHRPVEEQGLFFETSLDQHQGNAKQRDDITLVGVRV
jgi:ligand-binding sensor domain-containing protein/serine phosphatase RsbU (regulator of sigma subunit)